MVLLPSSICLIVDFYTHLAPIPLTLGGGRWHFGLLFASLELFSGLDHFAGVIFTGGTVPGGNTWEEVTRRCQLVAVTKQGEL